jgi:hypothetical protein
LLFRIGFDSVAADMQNALDADANKWGRLRSDIGAILFLAGLCVAAYLPSFNNGFISDDYVILGRLDSLQHDFLYLCSIPPECFRLTSYVFFGILRYLFGYHAEWYYAFNLLLHFVNSVLLWKLLTRVTRSSQLGFLAAVLFAAIQGHQEAIMWLAAMNETLLGLCLLVCLLLWEKGLPAWGSLPYVAGLFSKESAIVFLALLPLLERRSRGSLRCHRGYLLLLGISGAFGILFYLLTAENFMLGTGTYAFGFQAVPVFLVSLHRLMFPWVYLAIILRLLRHRRWHDLKPAGWGLSFAAIALLPYIFLTYQVHVASRQEYMASMGIAWALAILIQGLDSRVMRTTFIFTFIVANIGYIWIKDKQFEQRAAPTNRLIEQLKSHAPQDVAIIDFPANPWIAKNAARMVPGWQPEMIHVDPPASECSTCLGLRWDPRNESYSEIHRQ